MDGTRPHDRVPGGAALTAYGEPAAYVRLALIGDPVEHSRSPGIQAAFLRERGLDGTYDAFAVPAGKALEALTRLRQAGYLGINATTPLKEEAYDACDAYDAVAAEVGAVNTLTLSPQRVGGANTDGAGALHALRVAIGSVENAWVLVLGAGPTARAAMLALKEAGAHVFVWNRTHAKAEALAQRYGIRVWEPGLRADAALSTLPPNATAPYAVRAALVTCPVVVDANYGPRATLALELDRPVIDGITMLQGSARASFEIWMEALAGR